MQTVFSSRNLVPEWVQLLRHETPSTTSSVHFNNAGSSPMPSSTAMVVTRHIQLEQEVGGYEAQRVVNSQSESVYNSIAQLINCDPNEIALLESAGKTEYKSMHIVHYFALHILPLLVLLGAAWSRGMSSVALCERDVIMTSQAEYGGNWAAMLQVARRTGAVIQVRVYGSTYIFIDV